MVRIILLLFFVLLISPGVFSQDSNSDNLLSVYLDCRSCRDSFVRSEIDFINFVRDQADAEVHLIVTSQGTGAGGREYSLEFIGQGELSRLSTTSTFSTYDSDTDEEERNALVKNIKLGFVPFLAANGALDNFDLRYTGASNTTKQIANTDRWNNWIFEIGGSTFFSGEESQNSLNLNGRIRARRITEKWKFNFNYNYGYDRNAYQTDSLRINTVTQDTSTVSYYDVYTTENQNVFGQLVYSLNDHWSVGSYFNAGSSSRENIYFRIGATPAVEYSFYPYREYARREVTLRYGLFTSLYDYNQATIYGKEEEILVRQELNFSMDYTKPWGGIEANMNARSYLHDFSKNRLGMGFEVNMRIVRGLNVFFDVNYSLINDQLSISADGVTDKEAIANTRQQLTSYDFWGRVGLEITFGSIYDNVVNTRF